MFMSSGSKYRGTEAKYVVGCTFVIDRGCGSVIILFLHTLCGWIPGGHWCSNHTK